MSQHPRLQQQHPKSISMNNFVITTRSMDGNGNFGNEVGETQFIEVPDTEKIEYTKQHVVGKDNWLKDVLQGSPADILIYVHGFNNGMNDVLTRHNTVKTELVANGYQGKVISFDWACGQSVMLYLEDRHKADLVCIRLINDCITILNQQQTNGCTANVHVLAHSTGAYIVREAFGGSNISSSDASTFKWQVAQCVFVAGDISSDSMDLSQKDIYGFYEHVVRVTNYYNPYDEVLKISNSKRLGFSPRVGRVGLPQDTPSKCVDINCGNTYNAIPQKGGLTYGHAWYFDPSNNQIFMKDLAYTIMGNIDRNYIPTRTRIDDDRFTLNG
jgi:esterase/lipase superfamily enzyme